jgi:prophage regulatory protein
MNVENERVVREAECKDITGLSRTTRWRLERTEDFPRRRQISDNAVGWLLSELQVWLETRKTARFAPDLPKANAQPGFLQRSDGDLALVTE